MDGLQVFLWILAIIGLLYILAFFYCLSAVIDFKSRLKRRVTALSVVFSEKKDVLMALSSYYQGAKISFSSADREALAAIANVPSKNIKDHQVKDIHDTLSSFEKRLVFLGENNVWVKQGDEYQSMMALLSDLNSNYRKIIAVYNSDLIGYEYWRKQPLYRWLFFIFGFRAKKRLS